MDLHPLSKEDFNHLKAIADKTPFAAQLRIDGKNAEGLSEEEAAALQRSEPPALHFSVQTLGVRIGGIACRKAGEGEDAKVRWDLQFDAASLDRFAAASRHRDWKHGLIGKSMRAVWAAADALELPDKAPQLADLLQPEEFTATRWDASRDKEKDRVKDIPLVNVNESGGGATPLRQPLAKAGSKAKRR
jgi:hypothetical protein